MATKITVDEVTQDVTVTVSNERGPSGLGSVTSATTSDGTANLSLASATVSGTLTADHIHGNLAGSVYLHIRAGEALSKGDPVYVSGSHDVGAAMVPIVMRADASNPTKMPAIAIMDAAVANNGNGHAVISGTIADLNTSAYSINSTLYVANGGGMTATKPANAQPVARVERSNANNGGIVVKVNGLYSDVSVASSQVTDATAQSTPNTIAKRDTRGSAAFGIGETYNANYEVYIGGDYPISGLENGNLWSIDQTGITTDRSYALPDASGTIVLDTTLTAASIDTALETATEGQKIDIQSKLEIVPSTQGGTKETFRWHAEQVAIADGADTHGRAYHAFPDLQKIGNTYWLSHMTSGTHADRRGDIVLKSSSDLKSWTERHRFSASRPSGTIVTGDFEYRAGTVCDLGSGSLICVLHKYNVINSADLSSSLGNVTAYSLSRDNGNTWTTPVELPRINNSYPAIGGMQCAVWKGVLYVPCYSTNALGAGVYTANAAALRAGVASFTATQQDFDQEPVAMVNPNNPDELFVFGRTNDTKIRWRKTTDGVTWPAQEAFYSPLSSVNIGVKPQITQTQDGTKWVFMNRADGGGSLEAELVIGDAPMVIYSGDGNPDDELWEVSRLRRPPNPNSPFGQRAWQGNEKLMYAGIIPEAGDLLTIAYSLEPQEQNNTISATAGQRSSVFVGFTGSGDGLTPFGPFIPAIQELTSPSIDLNSATESSFYWMTGNTEFVIADGSKTIALEILGDFSPSFSDGVNALIPSGSYNPNLRNVAVISPGPVVQIVNANPTSPAEIAGLRDSVLAQFSPFGIKGSGAISSWVNEGDASYVSALTAGTTAPSILESGSPNGRRALQGASGAFLNNAGGNVPLNGIYALVTAEGAVWAGDFSAVVTNAIQGQAAGSATWQVGSPWAHYTRYKDGITDSPAAAPSTGWAILAHRQRPVTEGTGVNFSPAVASNISVIMSQSGFTANRGWRGKLAALVLIQGDHYITDREDYLIRRWMRSL